MDVIKRLCKRQMEDTNQRNLIKVTALDGGTYPERGPWLLCLSITSAIALSEWRKKGYREEADLGGRLKFVWKKLTVVDRSGEPRQSLEKIHGYISDMIENAAKKDMRLHQTLNAMSKEEREKWREKQVVRRSEIQILMHRQRWNAKRSKKASLKGDSKVQAQARENDLTEKAGEGEEEEESLILTSADFANAPVSLQIMNDAGLGIKRARKQTPLEPSPSGEPPLNQRLRFPPHNDPCFCIRDDGIAELTRLRCLNLHPVPMFSRESLGISCLVSRSEALLYKLIQNPTEAETCPVIAIPSKGRAALAHLDLSALLGDTEALIVVVVEPQDQETYQRHIGPDQLLVVLDKNSQGVAYVREWILHRLSPLLGGVSSLLSIDDDLQSVRMRMADGTFGEVEGGLGKLIAFNMAYQECPLWQDVAITGAIIARNFNWSRVSMRPHINHFVGGLYFLYCQKFQGKGVSYDQRNIFQKEDVDFEQQVISRDLKIVKLYHFVADFTDYGLEGGCEAAKREACDNDGGHEDKSAQLQIHDIEEGQLQNKGKKRHRPTEDKESDGEHDILHRLSGRKTSSGKRCNVAGSSNQGAINSTIQGAKNGKTSTSTFNPKHKESKTDGDVDVDLSSLQLDLSDEAINYHYITLKKAASRMKMIGPFTVTNAIEKLGLGLPEEDLLDLLRGVAAEDQGDRLSSLKFEIVKPLIRLKQILVDYVLISSSFGAKVEDAAKVKRVLDWKMRNSGVGEGEAEFKFKSHQMLSICLQLWPEAITKASRALDRLMVMLRSQLGEVLLIHVDEGYEDYFVSIWSIFVIMLPKADQLIREPQNDEILPEAGMYDSRTNAWRLDISKWEARDNWESRVIALEPEWMALRAQIFDLFDLFPSGKDFTRKKLKLITSQLIKMYKKAEWHDLEKSGFVGGDEYNLSRIAEKLMPRSAYG